MTHNVIDNHATNLLSADSNADADKTPLFVCCATVVDIIAGHPVLDSTLLTPSHPCHAGDQGTIGDVRVVDVLEESKGFLHVLERPIGLKRGREVLVHLDSNRRDRLERTRTAVALACAEIARVHGKVLHTEVAAGLAWLETDNLSSDIDIRTIIKSDVALKCTTVTNNALQVEICGVTVSMMTGPIGATSRMAEGAELRHVSPLDSERTTLEIAVPDGKGKWWR